MSRKAQIEPTGFIIFYNCPIKRAPTEYHCDTDELPYLEDKEYVLVKKCFECGKQHHVKLP